MFQDLREFGQYVQFVFIRFKKKTTFEQRYLYFKNNLTFVLGGRSTDGRMRKKSGKGQFDILKKFSQGVGICNIKSFYIC